MRGPQKILDRKAENLFTGNCDNIVQSQRNNQSGIEYSFDIHVVTGSGSKPFLERERGLNRTINARVMPRKAFVSLCSGIISKQWKKYKRKMIIWAKYEILGRHFKYLLFIKGKSNFKEIEHFWFHSSFETGLSSNIKLQMQAF